MSPIFSYLCQNCKEPVDEIRPIAQAEDPIFCPECGHQMEHVVERPSKFVRGKGTWVTPA